MVDGLARFWWWLRLRHTRRIVGSPAHVDGLVVALSALHIGVCLEFALYSISLHSTAGEPSLLVGFQMYLS